jgi:hypothetical protein
MRGCEALKRCGVNPSSVDNFNLSQSVDNSAYIIEYNFDKIIW